MTENMQALFNKRNLPIILFYIIWWSLNYQNPVVYLSAWFMISLSIAQVLLSGKGLSYVVNFVVSIVIFVLSLKV